MAIEDFEWEGEGATAPAKPSVWARLKARATASVWVEPALKLGGMAALLGVLSGIGVVATTYAKPGLPLPERPRAVAAALGTSWLKPAPAASELPSGRAHPPDSRAASSAAGAVSSVAGAASGAAPSAGTPAESPSDSAAPGVLVGTTPDGKVILNLASAEELTQLPGVGLKRAHAIVALRTKLKRFKSATELLRVKGIGPRGLQRMLPHLVLDAPAAVSS